MEVKKNLKKVFLYIKGNPAIFRVLGAIFFLLTLIVAVFWSLGNDVESIAFTLSLISSIFFGLPSVAEFFYPNRKSVYDMSYDEMIAFMIKTDPKSDWSGLSKNWSSEYFLKEDPRLRINMHFDESGIQNDDFIETWANKSLHPKSIGYWCNIYYDRNLIERIVLVNVDDGACFLPTPAINSLDFDSLEVEDLNYFCALIFDSSNKLKDYFNKSGLMRKNAQ